MSAAARRHAAIVALGAVVTSLLYGWLLWKVYPTMAGDEPHYVLTARSLVEDGDVDLRNDYDDPARWGPVYPGHPQLERHQSAFDYRGDGTLRRVHNVGLPMLLLPSQLVKPGFRSAQVTMVVIAVVTMAALLSLLLRLGRRWWQAVAVWAVVALTLPVLAFSNQVYPEMPAALVIVVVAHLLLWGRPAGLVAAGALAAALPWLHVRYWLLVPVVLGFVLWRAEGWRTRALALAPVVVGGLVMAVFFQRWYGSPLPTAPYDVAAYEGAGRTDLATLYRLGLGSLFTPAYGLVPYSPALWLGLVGVGAVAARWRRVGLAAAAGAAFYVVAVAVANGAAFSLPARFLIPVVPLLAVSLLALVELGMGALAAFGVLALANVVVAWPVTSRFGDLYDIGVARYPPVARVERLYPVVREDVGLVSLDAPADAFQPRRPGVVGMLTELRPGQWVLQPRFDGGPPVRVVVVDVTTGRRRIDETAQPGEPVYYRSRHVRPVSIELEGVVPGDPRLRGMTGRLLGPAATDEPERFPDLPKAGAWVLATVGGGVVAYRWGRRST